MRLETVGTTLVAKLDGEIDQSNATEIREKIDREISLNNMKNLVLDFDKVTFMDSSGIGMLIGSAEGGVLSIGKLE